MPRKTGFTLIELLIVVSIIAVLSVIGFASFANFLKNSRDAKRQSDLKFIQTALEQYHADQKYYPGGQAPGSPCSTYPDGVFVLLCPLKSPDGRKLYLSQVPNDPKGAPAYCYEALECDTGTPPKCKNYYLYTKLENSPAPSVTGCTFTDFNLKVTRP